MSLQDRIPIAVVTEKTLMIFNGIKYYVEDAACLKDQKYEKYSSRVFEDHNLEHDEK